MADGRKNNGGKREGAGRKPKAQEQQLIEKLSPLDTIAFKKLEEGVREGSYNFIKLFMEYRFGKPRETVSMTHELPLPPKKAFTDFGSERDG